MRRPGRPERGGEKLDLAAGVPACRRRVCPAPPRTPRGELKSQRLPPSRPARPGAPHLLQGEEKELLGQQLRVQQQLRIRAAATAHIPRHHRRQETPAGYPQGPARKRPGSDVPSGAAASGVPSLWVRRSSRSASQGRLGCRMGSRRGIPPGAKEVKGLSAEETIGVSSLAGREGKAKFTERPTIGARSRLL